MAGQAYAGDGLTDPAVPQRGEITCRGMVAENQIEYLKKSHHPQTALLYGPKREGGMIILQP